MPFVGLLERVNSKVMASLTFYISVNCSQPPLPRIAKRTAARACCHCTAADAADVPYNDIGSYS